MFNSLLRLLSDPNLNYGDLESRLYNATSRLSKLLNQINNGESSFEKTTYGYELKYKLASDATAKNVDVEYDESDRTLEITYRYNNGNYKSTSKLVETLPDDADDKTIEAVVEDGELVIKVQAKADEPAADEPTDTKTVKIHRLANN